MAELMASGRIIDLILLTIIVEMVALVVWRLRAGRGPALLGLIANMLAGACLLLAFRSALNHGSWVATATFLFCALIAHIVDLISRWRT